MSYLDSRFSFTQIKYKPCSADDVGKVAPVSKQEAKNAYSKVVLTPALDKADSRLHAYREG
jgi:hypothetical protein